MKIIGIPPYKHSFPGRRSVETELADKMKARGQLAGVEIDFDEGYDIQDDTKKRDEEFLAKITLGTIIKVKQYCEMGRYDAIVTLGTMGMGFLASRSISRIPVVTAVHAGFHVASFIGDRFALIEATVPQAMVARHNAQLYGLSDKLASVRVTNHTSTDMSRFIHQYKKDERNKIPEVKEVIDDIVQQSIKAIENDRADTLILGCTPLQCFEEELRVELDKRGYNEIPIVCEFFAAVEMAKNMVNLKLTQAARAYPTDSLMAKPEFW